MKLLPSRVRSCLIAATALLAFGIPAGSAHAARGLEVAIQDEPVLLYQNYYNREKALQQLQQLNVSWVRINVQWAKADYADANSRSVPANPRYDWSQYDNLIDTAAAHGMHVEVSLTGKTPAYASGDGQIGPVRPSPFLYGKFVQAAAQHFKGRVSRYTIWNESNLGAWLSPLKQGPAIYRQLYQAGYAAIKGVDPTAQVLMGPTSPYALRKRATSPLAFLRAVNCVTQTKSGRLRPKGNCSKLIADGYAHHTYDFILPIGPPSRKFPSKGCSQLSKKTLAKLNRLRPSVRRSVKKRLERAQLEKTCPDAKNAATLGTISRLTKLLNQLAALGRLSDPQGKPLNLYLTEYGYFEIGKRTIKESLRAKYLVQAFQIALRNPRIKQLLQYELVQPPVGFNGAFFDTAIVARNGVPKASYLRLRTWAQGAGAAGLITKPVPFSLPPAPTG
jgi:hypothetical protein